MPTHDVNQCTLMIGNPGVGKSTILNGLVGEPLFKSGNSFGRGLTQVLQIEQASSGAMYGDTPGLADVELRQKAAEEICKALKTNHGRYQLIFVVTEEAGRIRPVDVATIKLVLDALSKDRRMPYGIIVNKISKKRVRQLEADPEGRSRMIACLNAGRDDPTAYVHFYARNEDLEDEADVVHIPTPELKAFLQILPFVSIAPEEVGKVYADQFDELNDRFEREIKRLSEDKAALIAELSKQKYDLDQQYAEMARMGCMAVEAIGSVGYPFLGAVAALLLPDAVVVAGGIIAAGSILGLL
jgi:GTP-binding protein EngB required for normal cell division